MTKFTVEEVNKLMAENWEAGRKAGYEEGKKDWKRIGESREDFTKQLFLEFVNSKSPTGEIITLIRQEERQRIKKLLVEIKTDGAEWVAKLMPNAPVILKSDLEELIKLI